MAYGREREATGATVVINNFNFEISVDQNREGYMSVEAVLLKGLKNFKSTGKTRLTLKYAKEILGIVGEGGSAHTRELLDEIGFLTPILLGPGDQRPTAWNIDMSIFDSMVHESEPKNPRRIVEIISQMTSPNEFEVMVSNAKKRVRPELYPYLTHVGFVRLAHFLLLTSFFGAYPSVVSTNEYSRSMKFSEGMGRSILELGVQEGLFIKIDDGGYFMRQETKDVLTSILAKHSKNVSKDVLK